MAAQRRPEQDTNIHVNMKEEKFMRPQHYKRATGNQEMQKVRKIVFAREEPPLGYPMPNGQL